MVEGGSNAQWKVGLEIFAAAAGISGLVLFATLSLAYDRFYQNLGVDPSDVGFTYGSTLARSTGLALWFGFYALFFAVVGMYWRWWTRVHPLSTGRVAVVWTRHPHIALAALLAVALLGTGVALVIRANLASDNVKSGMPVDPIAFGPLNLLSIQASRVIVERAQSGVPGSGTGLGLTGLDRLQERRLLYLGQADSTVVLYDAEAREAIKVPSNTVLLRIENS